MVWCSVKKKARRQLYIYVLPGSTIGNIPCNTFRTISSFYYVISTNIKALMIKVTHISTLGLLLLSCYEMYHISC